MTDLAHPVASVASGRVVITGAAGLVGAVLTRGLGQSHEVTGVDRRRAGHVRSRPVRMTSPRAVRRAFDGADVVVDLAADPDPDLDWRTAHANNIRATWTALESAAAVGVRRVIFASSNHVTGGCEAEEPYASVLAGRRDGLDTGSLPRIGAAHEARPDGAYAVGKICGEAAGRYFSDVHRLSVICLRLGSVTRDDRPREPRHLSTLLTHRDLVQLVDRCIRAPDHVRFAVLYGVSANTWRIWDIGEAERLIGYAPYDDAERWRELVLA